MIIVNGYIFVTVTVTEEFVVRPLQLVRWRITQSWRYVGYTFERGVTVGLVSVGVFENLLSEARD